MTKRLTAALVRSIQNPGKYHDEHGLFLRVMPSGSRQWVQRLTVHGKRRDIGLGGYPLVLLAQARETALTNRRLARAGGDPLALKRSDVPTFAEAVETVIEMHAKSWRNGGKTAALWRTTMLAYVLPRLGRRPVDSITTADVMAVLLPIWTTKRATARKVRHRIGKVMKWAVAQGHRQDNPAGEAIGAALPKAGATVSHLRALPHAEIADAIEIVRGSKAAITTKLAFEFLVLTATRSGEVRRSTWIEIDLESRTWTIPGERTKTGREHKVPLSSRALVLLSEAQEVSDGSGLIFPSATGRTMTDSTISKLLRELGVGMVPHGARSSFRDFCGEGTNVAREVAEACLAHVTTSEVEQAYARSDLFEKRRKLMELWATYLGGGGQVVPMVRTGNTTS